MAPNKSAKKKPLPAKKPVAKKLPAKPAAKSAPKPAAKVPAKISAAKSKATKPVVSKGKPAAPVKAILVKGKPVPVAKAALVKGKPAPAAKVVLVKGKPVPAPAPVKGKKMTKAEAKAAAISHEEQRRLLSTHRQGHDQQSPVEAPVVKPKLLVFTLEDVRSYLKGRRAGKLNLWVPDEERKSRERTSAAANKANAAKKPNKVGAASLNSLFGFNPFKKANPADLASKIPEKWRRYHKLLLEARAKLEVSVARHTEEALKKSGKDDAGDLSGYSQHLADAGTDTADRDFALNLISSEQQQIKEVDDAIERMRTGSYGVCEITNRPIPASRLASVPHTRYSIEGQKELERQRRAQRRRGGNPLGIEGDEIGFGSGGGGGDDGGGDDN